MKLIDFLDSLESTFENYQSNHSLGLAVELHHKYRVQGFKPEEFYFYITGLSVPSINSWSDAVIKLAYFIDEREISNAIN